MGTSKYRVWEQDELAALRRGIGKHGAGNWEAIRKDPELAGTLAGRSGEQIKDKWRNLIKFNHVSAEEAKACARSSRSRGVKRAQTFDTTTTFQQRLEAGTLQQQPAMPFLVSKSISEEMMNADNMAGAVSSSATGPAGRAVSPRRRVKSRQTVADFRHHMAALEGLGGLSRDPLAFDTARLELTGMAPPPVTTGQQDYGFQNLDMVMRSGSESSLQPQATFSAGNSTLGMQQGSNGSVMQGILSDFGLDQGMGGFPAPGQYQVPDEFPLDMDTNFSPNQFRGAQQEYPNSSTWNSSYSNQQRSPTGGPKRVSFDIAPPVTFPGSYGGMMPGQMYPSQQQQQLQQQHMQQQQQHQQQQQQQQQHFGQNLGPSPWNNMPDMSSNSFSNPQDQNLFPPMSAGTADFGMNPQSFENAPAFGSFPSA